jgi:cell division protein FtsL
MRRPRAPFILLLVGLLGGALVSLLFISTTLAQGSYRITSLQQQNASLARQEQVLTQQVAQESSPTQIAQEAEAFGMRPNPNLQFLNLKTRKVVKGQVSKADSEINVPGYTP